MRDAREKLRKTAIPRLVCLKKTPVIVHCKRNRVNACHHTLSMTGPSETKFHNNIYLLQLGCHLVAVVILHVYKT